MQNISAVSKRCRIMQEVTASTEEQLAGIGVNFLYWELNDVASQMNEAINGLRYSATIMCVGWSCGFS